MHSLTKNSRKEYYPGINQDPFVIINSFGVVHLPGSTRLNIKLNYRQLRSHHIAAKKLPKSVRPAHLSREYALSSLLNFFTLTILSPSVPSKITSITVKNTEWYLVATEKIVQSFLEADSNKMQCFVD